MKFVIGIILVALLMAALIVYLVLMLNAHDMIFCGDVANTFTGNRTMVTRVYTTDLSADETLSEIVLRMNTGEGESITSEELTEILATYQDIIYAPVFIISLDQVDESTFVLSGSVWNGVNEDGEPVDTDYVFKNMALTAAVGNADIISAQNVYPLGDDGEQEFVERKMVVEPVVTENGSGASFAFQGCDSFRIVLTETGELPAEIVMYYTYDVVAENPINFTGITDGALACSMRVAYDDKGQLAPEFSLERVSAADEQ